MESPIIMGAFGERLKSLRKNRKLTQTQMAELLNMTVRQYQRTEYGEVNVPSLTVIALADFFQVSTDYLLGRSDER